MVEGALHTSEYSVAYSGGFNDPLLPSDDDVSPSFCDWGYVSGQERRQKKRTQRSPALDRQTESQSPL